MAQPAGVTRRISPIEALADHYRKIRRDSEQACEPLVIEDFGLQAEAFTSPPKWHLAHTSWFFETFLLLPYVDGYQRSNPAYAELFNSYYNGIGEPFSRSQRGLLSRPTVAEVMEYRHEIDESMCTLLAGHQFLANPELVQRTLLGLNHEQQHQELFYTDLKFNLFQNPLYPVFRPSHNRPDSVGAEAVWLDFPSGLYAIGHQGEGFAFDNELPRHDVHVAPFGLMNRLVSNAEFQQFIDDGGYQRADLWLADGWIEANRQGWQHPLYWLERDGEEMEFSLHGLRRRDPHEPVCHLSAYEADAYARWADARLPTEPEWEVAATSVTHQGSPFDGDYLSPKESPGGEGLQQMFSDVWEWTSSAYAPYPGFRPEGGAIGEYNGKFMCSQLVLRGGSCVTPPGHTRPSYRNFFYPPDRWQFSGLRLARDNR